MPAMLVLPENHFAVLTDESQYEAFAAQVNGEDSITTVYIVTDSEPGYREMISGRMPRTPISFTETIWITSGLTTEDVKMKVELFPFQKMALFQLRRKTAEALGSYQRTHTPQVLSFTAPTGAGKTIILASLIESIYFGDEEYPDQPDAIFVWLSDSPELNEQSRSKIDLKADKIRLDQCVTITDRILRPGDAGRWAYLFSEHPKAGQEQ